MALFEYVDRSVLPVLPFLMVAGSIACSLGNGTSLRSSLRSTNIEDLNTDRVQRVPSIYTYCYYAV
jgi:hypothetical protein